MGGIAEHQTAILGMLTLYVYVHNFIHICACTYVLLTFLQCNGKEIKWEHLAALYERDRGAVREAPGLSLVPKLKWEHIHLTSFSKMRVDLAAQVSD